MGTNWPFQVQSFLILFLLFAGLYFRKNRKIHVRIMGTAIAWDVLLILQIEFSRNAIAKASKILQNPFLLNFHVTLALCTVVLYVILVFLGRGLLKGQKKYLPLHKKLGLTAVFLRTITLITSFFTHTSP